MVTRDLVCGVRMERDWNPVILHPIRAATAFKWFNGELHFKLQCTLQLDPCVGLLLNIDSGQAFKGKIKMLVHFQVWSKLFLSFLFNQRKKWTVLAGLFGEKSNLIKRRPLWYLFRGPLTDDHRNDPAEAFLWQHCFLVSRMKKRSRSLPKILNINKLHKRKLFFEAI